LFWVRVGEGTGKIGVFTIGGSEVGKKGGLQNRRFTEAGGAVSGRPAMCSWGKSYRGEV